MIPSQRRQFDIPDDVAYLNCAYMSPLMHEVVAAGEIGLRRKARPWEIGPADFFDESEETRARFAAIVHASADGVAIVPSASYGIAVAARNLPVREGERILILAEQFPSNVYAWRAKARATGAELVALARPEDGDWTARVLEAIDERTAVAALPNCHWTDGGLVDLERVGARCREAGAALVLDLSQSCGARPFDVGAVRPDFMVTAAYKWLLGPYSMGFLYVAPEHREGEPIEHNWIARERSEDFAGLVDYRDAYQPGARRFDVGERANFALMPMTLAALGRILEWGVDRIAATLGARNRAIAARAERLGLGAVPDELRAGHYLGLRFPGGVPDGLLGHLAGHNVHLSVRGSSVRVTPHLWNTDDDVERLFEALEAAL